MQHIRLTFSDIGWLSILIIVFHKELVGDGVDAHHHQCAICHLASHALLEIGIAHDFGEREMQISRIPHRERIHTASAGIGVLREDNHIIDRVVGQGSGIAFKERQIGIHICHKRHHAKGIGMERSVDFFLQPIPHSIVDGVDFHRFGSEEEIAHGIHLLRALQIGRNERIEHHSGVGFRHFRHGEELEFRVGFIFEHPAEFFHQFSRISGLLAFIQRRRQL